MMLRPPRSLILPGGVAAVAGDNRRRITELEQARNVGGARRVWCLTVVGTGLGSTLTTPPWRPWAGEITVTHADARLSGTLSNDLTLQLQRSGTTVATMVVPAGESGVRAPIDVRFSPGDTLSVDGSMADAEAVTFEMQLWCVGPGGGHLPVTVESPSTTWTVTFTASDQVWQASGMWDLDVDSATLISVRTDCVFVAGEKALVNVWTEDNDTEGFGMWGEGYYGYLPYHPTRDEICNLYGTIDLDDTAFGPFPSDPVGRDPLPHGAYMVPPVTIGAGGSLGTWVEPDLSDPWSGTVTFTFEGTHGDVVVAMS